MQSRTPSPDRLELVTSLRDAGLFGQALKALENAPHDLSARLSAQVLKAELLERVGRRPEAAAIIQRIGNSKALTPADRSLCDFVTARICIESGEFPSAVNHLSRSINLAKRSGNLERLGFAQLKLFTVLSDGVGTDATGPLLAEVRANALKCGSPTLLCAIHVYFAQIEALRGSTQSANRHIRLASALLRDMPNFWLESVVENIRLALAIMTSELDLAEIHAERGQVLAEKTGGAAEYAVNQGNSGFLFNVLGKFEDAIECYERTLRLAVPGSQNHNGTLDSLARVRLAQGRFEECANLLRRIEESANTTRDRETYVYRHAQLTRAHLALRTRDFESARRSLSTVLRLAKDANDRLLEVGALIASVEVEARTANLSEAWPFIERIAPSLTQMPADVYGAFEKAVALASVAAGDLDGAGVHLARAKRVFGGLNNLQALADLTDSEEYKSIVTSTTQNAESAARAVLQSAVLVLAHVKHQELAAREVLTILWSTGAVHWIQAVSRSKEGIDRIVAECGSVPSDEDNLKHIAIGESTDRTVELLLVAKQDLQSVLTIEAAVQLVCSATTLKSGADERNDRKTIWPKDEFSGVGSGAVISGHMREQMTFAQRVARTTVNVLITGESGTGKEVLARAIHDYSDRAQKPFVPLNCAAVPRDLLESQLFGHRRGAFTGAERDHPGVIRGAAGGTLFLDEVGEMSLELQPKLLRFLESGEISPLGEPSPLTVNVRVIAATNTNLEDAVRDGRFREDLFYRLHVVPFSLRPLRERRDEIPGLVAHFVATAAREYKKGHLDVPDETMERLLLYRWPGNVRQLQNEIRRMVALAEPNVPLQPDAISADILSSMPHLRHAALDGREIAVPLQQKLLPTLSRIEYEMIKAALRENHGRLEPAAKALGISRKGLYLKRQRLGL